MKKIIIMLFIILQILFAQHKTQQYDGITYKKLDNTWHIYSSKNGVGDLVDTNNILFVLTIRAIFKAVCLKKLAFQY